METQEKLCREYAGKQDWEVAEVFVELGESAKTSDRTEFTKAINYCTAKKGRIGIFLVYKLDRFSRKAEDHLTVRAVLNKVGTALRSVTEPINETATGRLMETVIAGFAEFDNNVRTERTRGGMIQRVREGYWVWTPPLGYYKPMRGKKTNIVPDPVKAPLVRAGFEEYAKGGRTYKALAAFWTRQGLRTRRGKPIKHQEVQKMLINPVYCGVIKAFGGEWAGGFEPIVPRQLFLACQVKPGYSSWSKRRTAENPTFPLRKFVVCSECGTPLSGSATRGYKGKKYPYYHHSKKGCSKSRSIAKEKFERAFLERLEKITPNPKFEKLFKAVVIDIWKTRHKHLDAQRASVRRAIEKLELDRQRVFELHRSGVYSDEDFKEQKSVIGRQLDEQYVLIEDHRNDEFNMEQALGYCFEFVGKATKTWLELESNPQARVQFQQLIFKNKIPFDGENFGTTELSPIFQLKETLLAEESLLVAPRGIET